MKRVVIQGIKGSFHDIAAHQYFGQGEALDMVYADTFEALFDAMDSDPGLMGFAAIENTIAGSLLHNYELLLKSGVSIVGEHKLHIEHSIMCLPSDNWDTLCEVNSHPVAFMQCRNFPDMPPSAMPTPPGSTA